MLNCEKSSGAPFRKEPFFLLCIMNILRTFGRMQTHFVDVCLFSRRCFVVSGGRLSESVNIPWRRALFAAIFITLYIYQRILFLKVVFFFFFFLLVRNKQLVKHHSDRRSAQTSNTAAAYRGFITSVAFQALLSHQVTFLL